MDESPFAGTLLGWDLDAEVTPEAAQAGRRVMTHS
jgi:hypothetical protein